MKFSKTGQEKSDLSIQVTTWTGLTVYLSTAVNQYNLKS